MVGVTDGCFCRFLFKAVLALCVSSSFCRAGEDFCPGPGSCAGPRGLMLSKGTVRLDCCPSWPWGCWCPSQRPGQSLGERHSRSLQRPSSCFGSGSSPCRPPSSCPAWRSNLPSPNFSLFLFPLLQRDPALSSHLLDHPASATEWSQDRAFLQTTSISGPGYAHCL